MNLKLKNKMAVLYLFLFVAGFQYIMQYLIGDLTYTTYIVSIFAVSLLLIYIIPLLCGVHILVKKLQGSWGIFAGALVSGFFISTFLSAYGNGILDYAWAMILPENIIKEWGDALSAPLVEEVVKVLICGLFLYTIKATEKKHFLISGIGVGLGFQVFEDISYILPEAMGDGVKDKIIQNALGQISGSLASHWMYTAIVSVGVYIVYRQGKELKGYVYTILPIILHFIWNSPLVDGGLAIPLMSSILTTITVLVFFSVLKDVLSQEKLDKKQSGL